MLPEAAGWLKVIVDWLQAHLHRHLKSAANSPLIENTLCMSQVLKEHRLWTICAAKVLADGGRGVGILKATEWSAMEMDKRMG